MHTKPRHSVDDRDRSLRGAAIALCLLLLTARRPACGADLRISVVDGSGHGVAGVVLVAEKVGAIADKRSVRTETMDQKHMQFVPNILVIQAGSGVDFPNSDQIEHQVYSFSAPKSFQLSLYAGRKYPPVIFERPGLVTVGCNIHDTMIGYIYVTNSGFFGRSGADGQLQLHALPAGEYTLTAWHPLMQETTPELTQTVTVAADDSAAAVFHLSRPLRKDMSHMGDTRWADY